MRREYNSAGSTLRSEEHTSELQSRLHLVCRLLLEKKKKHDSTSVMPSSTGSAGGSRLVARFPPLSSDPLWVASSAWLDSSRADQRMCTQSIMLCAWSLHQS